MKRIERILKNFLQSNEILHVDLNIRSVFDNHDFKSNVVNLTQKHLIIEINLDENSAIAVDLEFLSTKLNSDNNVETTIKFNQSFSKLLLKKSRHSSSYNSNVELLKNSNFKTEFIEKLTDDLHREEQLLNLQFSQNNFNIFTEINMFSKNQQKFRTRELTKSCLEQRFTNAIESSESNLSRSIKNDEKKLNITEIRSF